MSYKNPKTLRRDLAAAGLLDFARSPDNILHAVIRDGVLHYYETSGEGPSRRTFRTNATLTLRELLDSGARSCDPEKHTCLCHHERLSAYRGPRSLDHVFDAVQHLQTSARRLHRLKNTDDAFAQSTKGLGELDKAAGKILRAFLMLTKGEDPELDAVRDLLTNQHNELRASWLEVAGTDPARTANLQAVREILAGGPDRYTHFPFNESTSRDVLIGILRPRDLSGLAASLLSTCTVVPPTSTGMKTILKAPAYVRDYLLLQGCNYYDVQLVDEPAATADPTIAALAASLWHSEVDGPMINLANAVAAVLAAHA